MFKSYFKTAIRFLLKNKTFSFINIIGLATGTLCCLYIVLYVQDQYSYDKQHKNVNDIYRVTTTLQLTGDNHNNSTSSPPIVPGLKNDFPEVIQYARAVGAAGFGAPKTLLTYKEKSFYQDGLVYVDSTFFDIFNYHFANGSPVKCLSEPYTAILLKPVAEKLFGYENPIGKVITLNNGFGKHDFKVNGVIDESLGKTNIQGSIFVAMDSGGLGDYTMKDQDWAGNNFAYSFIKLRAGTDPAELEKKFPEFINRHGGQQMKAMGMTKQLHLQRVADIHTTTGYENEMGKSISPSFLYILLLIAIMIQVIACINFMNLSTARASKRAKEVGVRKVIGADKFDLIKQFLGESFLLAFIGVVIALPLLWLVLPYLNQLTGSDIELSIFTDYRISLMLVILVIVTGLVAGSYPAFYLSAFKAIKVIKGNFTSHISAAGIRRSLVVFQFVLSIILITGIIIIYSQLDYIKNKDLGFDKNQKLIFSFYTSDTQMKMDNLVNDLRQMAEVKNVSKADNYLSQFVPHDHGVYPAGGNMTTAIDAQNIITDENVVKTNGIKIISGRDFRLNDTNRVLINQTLAKRLGLSIEKAPGTRLYSQYGTQPVSYVDVVGVMKDFNYNSLHTDVHPFMFVYDNHPQSFNVMVVAVNSANYKALLNKIQTVWQKDLPSTPFEYMFLDQEVQKQYEAEITMSQIINSFTLMAIIISCLGLFGLAAFSAEQRNKEIGIRKVLGASVSGIVGLLSKEFLQLVIISFIIATPIAWWGMHKWLQVFAYRIDLSWWMFALAGLIAVFIALFTVSFQAIKAALSNPVKSLKTE
jgi:putative ABC transport system permease protein